MPRGPHGIELWKFIRMWWDSFSCFVVFELGDGSSISFWDDIWCGESHAWACLVFIGC